jgi:hypothetical protein
MMAEQSAAIGDIARYADLLCALSELEDRKRMIEDEQAQLRETVIPALREVGVITLEIENGDDMSLWAERDPEDRTYNVESRMDSDEMS